MKVLIYTLALFALTACNKEKIGNHDIDCVIQFSDQPCDELIEIWQGDNKITLSQSTTEHTFKNGTINYRISGTTNGFGMYDVGFIFYRKYAELITEKYVYANEVGQNQPYNVTGSFELKKN
jgi:hypothetical protein